MNQITVTAMVLAVSPVGEYDRRVVLLTKERGKLAAFARGARRQGSALLGVTSPFSFGEFTLYEGRTSYTLMSASVSNYFEELRTDVEGAYYGFYFMDLASYYAREAADERELLKLLYQSLRALTNLHIPNRLVRCIFELRTIVIEGEDDGTGNVALSAAMLATGNINDRFESGADVFRTLDGIKRTTLPTIFPDPVRKALADWMRENNSTTKKR